VTYCSTPKHAAKSEERKRRVRTIRRDVRDAW